LRQDIANICIETGGERSNIIDRFQYFQLLNFHKRSLSKKPHDETFSRCIIYLWTSARTRSFLLTSLTFVIVDGGVKQSHWITLAFWRLCSLCCSATSDRLSYLPALISRDLNKILFQVNILWKGIASFLCT